MSEKKSKIPVLLPDITEDKKGQWRVLINHCDNTENINHVRFEHSKHGVVELGLRQNGAYVGPILAEYGGGGVVLMLYAHIKDMLWIGIVRQDRHNMSGKYSVPAGFIHKKEIRNDGVNRVFEEEISNYFTDRVIYLNENKGVNANRAFFWTPEREDGLSFHAVELKPEELITTDDKIYRLRKDLFDPTSDKEIEYIKDCILVPIEVAVHYLQDDFIHIGVSLLQAHLKKKSYN